MKHTGRACACKCLCVSVMLFKIQIQSQYHAHTHTHLRSLLRKTIQPINPNDMHIGIFLGIHTTAFQQRRFFISLDFIKAACFLLSSSISIIRVSVCVQHGRRSANSLRLCCCCEVIDSSWNLVPTEVINELVRKKRRRVFGWAICLRMQIHIHPHT